MAFLFQDQNQGIRNDAGPRANVRRPPQTVLFHPDYNRRLRNRTESADPSSLRWKKALAGLGYVTLTAGGDFHPALRTSAARLSGLAGNYDEWPGRQQAPSASGTCIPHVLQASLGRSERLLEVKSTEAATHLPGRHRPGHFRPEFA